MLRTNFDGETLIELEVEVEAPRQTSTIVTTDDSILVVAECTGVRSTRLSDSQDVYAKVFKNVDGRNALFASLLILNLAVDMGPL